MGERRRRRGRSAPWPPGRRLRRRIDRRRRRRPLPSFPFGLALVSWSVFSPSLVGCPNENSAINECDTSANTTRTRLSADATLPLRPHRQSFRRSNELLMTATAAGHGPLIHRRSPDFKGGPRIFKHVHVLRCTFARESEIASRAAVLSRWRYLESLAARNKKNTQK